MNEAPQHPLAGLVAELSQSAELTEPSKALLRPDIGPRRYLAALSAGDELVPDAVKLVAHLLPMRECVWWAWMNVRRASGEKPADKIRAALEATERWISEPNDRNRRAAFASAEVAGLDTPAGAVAVAIFFTGGSIAPPENPEVPPPFGAAPKILAASVLMGAVQSDPAQAPARMREAVKQAVEVADRIRLWPPESDAASPSRKN
jgi:hypothetical protein